MLLEKWLPGRDAKVVIKRLILLNKNIKQNINSYIRSYNNSGAGKQGLCCEDNRAGDKAFLGQIPPSKILRGGYLGSDPDAEARFKKLNQRCVFINGRRGHA